LHHVGCAIFRFPILPQLSPSTSTPTTVSPPLHRRRTASMATGVDAKLLKSTKFPPEFNQKVDMQKVNIQVMKK
jgi:hypothetical protein